MAEKGGGSFPPAAKLLGLGGGCLRGYPWGKGGQEAHWPEKDPQQAPFDLFLGRVFCWLDGASPPWLVKPADHDSLDKLC